MLMKLGYYLHAYIMIWNFKRTNEGEKKMKLKVLVDNNTYIDQYYCSESAISYY